MRRTLTIALGAAVALVASAVALAAVFTATGISATTATLRTEAAKDVRTRTCKSEDGKEFKITHGRYTGTADFTNPASEFDGPLALRVKTTVDTSNQLGYVEGSFAIRDDDTRVTGRFVGTLQGTTFSGFLTGKARGSHARVLGTLSGTFDPATGFGGELGNGSISSAVIAGPVCKGKHEPRPEPKPKPETRRKLASVDGQVSVISDSSITIAWRKGLPTATCVRDDASPAIDTAEYAVGTKVQMKCEYVNDNWTLRVLKKHR